MRAERLGVILLGGALLIGGSPQAAPRPGRVAHVHSLAALRQDLDVLQRALVEGDPGVNRYTDSSTVRRAFDAAARLLDSGMTTVQFYRVAAPLVALIRDGHANLRLPDSTLAEWRWNHLLLPLAIHVRHGRVFVFRDLSDPGEPAAGGVIESINGVPTGHLTELFLSATTGDGDVLSSRELDISGLTFAEDINLLAGLHAPFEVTIRFPGAGRPTPVHFAGSPREAILTRWRSGHPLDLELRAVRPPTEFGLLDGGRLAILTIPGWGSSQADADRRDLRGTFSRAFALMRDSSTRVLIIDVRNNGGGEDEPARILFSYLARRPFRWYDRVIVNDTSRFSFAKYIADPDPFDPGMLRRRPDGRYDLVGESSLGQLFQPVVQPFHGVVLALMNGGSFSTSTEFVAQLKATRRATLIGEESGGAFQGNNSGFEPVVVLPNTGLKLRLPLASYYMAVQGHARDRRGVMPDVSRSPNLREEQDGTDPIMDTALAMARRIVQADGRKPHNLPSRFSGTRRSTPVQHTWVEPVRLSNGAVVLRGFVTIPPTSGRDPGLVLVGGDSPWAPNAPYFQALTDSLVPAGFVVLRYDQRGDGASGGTASLRMGGNAGASYAPGYFTFKRKRLRAHAGRAEPARQGRPHWPDTERGPRLQTYLPPSDSEAAATPLCRAAGAIITGDSIGPLHVGQSLDEVLTRCKSVLAGWDWGDEGVPEPALAVRLGSMVVVATMEDTTLTARVVILGTGSPGSVNSEGVRIGMPMDSVPARLGSPQLIENDCALYATFAGHPRLGMRLTHPEGADCGDLAPRPPRLPHGSRVERLFLHS
jgi:hypothetical protein